MDDNRYCYGNLLFSVLLSPYKHWKSICQKTTYILYNTIMQIYGIRYCLIHLHETSLTNVPIWPSIFPVHISTPENLFKNIKHWVLNVRNEIISSQTLYLTAKTKPKKHDPDAVGIYGPTIFHHFQDMHLSVFLSFLKHITFGSFFLSVEYKYTIPISHSVSCVCVPHRNTIST